MKKVLFLSTLIAAVLLASSCKKEQELVTLGAVISQPGKTYIDDRYPCWNNGDQVYVNNAAYPISAASGPSAQIADVVGSDSYRAIFPASLVPANMDITNSSNIPVTLPATQLYTLVDGHQRVDAPMGAYTDGEILQFHNLCSIVHVVVNNNTGSDMALDKLRIATDNAYLSGAGTATVTGSDNDGITLSSDASHSVSLRIAGPTSVTLAAGAQSAFDIYVPAFPTDNVTITLYTTNGYYFELTRSNVALTHNTYTTVTLNVDNLTQILAAELVTGSTFNQAIPNNATAVVFEYNSSVTSGTLLSTYESPVPIYGNLNGTTWRVSTSACWINANPNSRYLFSNHNNLSSIDFGDNFSTMHATDMGELFSGCSNLTNIDLSNFNTENVGDMHWMFMDCYSLINLDLSNFNTENVWNMWNMFYKCNNLTNLNITNFNTKNVTTMEGMFYECSSLISLDVSHFNTENVTNMRCMFYQCHSLTSLDVSNFNTEKVTDMSGMFYGCSGLTSLDLSNFNTENVTNMNGMLSGFSSLTSLDVSNFNTENVTNMSSMFSGCTRLMSLDLSNFNTENVTDMQGMFYGCSGLTSLDLSNFNTENVTNMRLMFELCNSLASLDLSNFNTENVTGMSHMFFGCSDLTSLDLSNFNTENVTDMSHMFLECSNLTSLDLSNFDMSSVTNKEYMCHALSTTSGHCTIICPTAVQTELENGTSLPSGVTFTWVRPTSK